MFFCETSMCQSCTLLLGHDIGTEIRKLYSKDVQKHYCGQNAKILFPFGHVCWLCFIGLFSILFSSSVYRPVLLSIIVSVAFKRFLLPFDFKHC